MKVEPVFNETHIVNWENCDMFGRLTLAGLNNIITITAGNHALVSGIGYPHMKVHKQAWVLIRLHIVMKRIALWTEKITCRTWVADFNGILSQRVFQLYCGQELIGEASSIWSVINYELRAPQQMLAEYDASSLCPEKPIDVSKATKIKLPENTKVIGEHTVVFSDIDAMQHVNNTKYTEWIYNCLPLDVIKNFKGPVDLHYNYMSELVIGEKVEIKSGENGVFVISRKGSDKPCFALQINTIKQ